MMKCEYNFDNDISNENVRNFYGYECDEETDDASETEMVMQHCELKERFYQDKLSNLKYQLQQLKDGFHSDYMKNVKELEAEYNDRLKMAAFNYEYDVMQKAEDEYEMDIRSAHMELKEKEIELRETLIIELEDKRKIIEYEQSSFELAGDSLEVKPLSTRKLRRRTYDPLPTPDKRRKTSPSILNILPGFQLTLDENDIMEDLVAINTIKPIIPTRKTALESRVISSENIQNDVRIENGRLLYEKKWYYRGQPVYIESKQTDKFSAVICAIGVSEILVRNLRDNSKIRVSLLELENGKCTIKRRSS